MSSLRFDSLKFSVDEFSMGLDLKVESGRYFCLMGETGCGKTLLMELLCGIRQPDEGSILIGDVDATSLKPSARGIGYVPQNGALFSHLNVEKNIGFGLSVRRVHKNLKRRKVEQAAEMLGISHLLGRSVEMLSGGERQRVALARALVIEPKLLVLDEPVSALDELTRESVLTQLKKLQTELSLTVVHVNHSYEETLAVADSLAVMRSGKLLQAGPLDEVLQQPSDSYVARLLRV